MLEAIERKDWTVVRNLSKRTHDTVNLPWCVEFVAPSPRTLGSQPYNYILIDTIYIRIYDIATSWGGEGWGGGKRVSKLHFSSHLREGGVIKISPHPEVWVIGPFFLEYMKLVPPSGCGKIYRTPHQDVKNPNNPTRQDMRMKKNLHTPQCFLKFFACGRPIPL